MTWHQQVITEKDLGHMENKDLDQSQNFENNVRTLGSKIRIVRLSSPKVQIMTINNTYCWEKTQNTREKYPTQIIFFDTILIFFCGSEAVWGLIHSLICVLRPLLRKKMKDFGNIVVINGPDTLWHWAVISYVAHLVALYICIQLNCKWVQIVHSKTVTVS